EEKWPEFCRATKNIKLMIALERSTVKEDNGSLVLLFDDKDKVMVDLLNSEGTLKLLNALLEEQVGFVPQVIPRLASYYENYDVPADDPLDLLKDNLSSEDINIDDKASTSSNNSEDANDGEEEYNFEEDDDEEKENFNA
ncbi:MAG: hypothetical protein Q8882_06300, partial [Bacillota bacterium]|nr:hypothetical protein [Bacillota bacterium]